MDLTPEQTKISANALAAVDDNCLQWVRNVTSNPKAVVAPLAQERVHEIADLVWGLAYRAGREDAAREVKIDEIRRAVRRVCARIVASAHLLDAPFTDAPDQSPWTKAKRDMAALYEAVGIRMADGVNCCTCPDCDVTAFNEKPGSRTVKGRDDRCPVHGPAISLGRSEQGDGDSPEEQQ